MYTRLNLVFKWALHLAIKLFTLMQLLPPPQHFEPVQSSFKMFCHPYNKHTLKLKCFILLVINVQCLKRLLLLYKQLIQRYLSLLML